MEQNWLENWSFFSDVPSPLVRLVWTLLRSTLQPTIATTTVEIAVIAKETWIPSVFANIALKENQTVPDYANKAKLSACNVLMLADFRLNNTWLQGSIPDRRWNRNSPWTLEALNVHFCKIENTGYSCQSHHTWYLDSFFFEHHRTTYLFLGVYLCLNLIPRFTRFARVHSGSNLGVIWANYEAFGHFRPVISLLLLKKLVLAFSQISICGYFAW